MKLNSLFITCILVLSAATTVRADGIPTDGKVVVGHGTDPGVSQPCGNTGPTIDVHLNHGGGVTNCFNDSGQEWTGLDITAQIPMNNVANCVAAGGFTCGTPVYTPLGNSGKKKVEIMLFGLIPSSPSDTMSSEFFLNFDDSGNSMTGPGGWFGAADGKLNGIVKVRPLVSTPEPAVVILVLVGGLGVLCFCRRS